MIPENPQNGDGGGVGNNKRKLADAYNYSKPLSFLASCPGGPMMSKRLKRQQVYVYCYLLPHHLPVVDSQVRYCNPVGSVPFAGILCLFDPVQHQLPECQAQNQLSYMKRNCSVP